MGNEGEMPRPELNMGSVQDITDQMAALRTTMKNEGRTTITNLLRSFMIRYPEVEFLRWEQYTPYFMDGDACIFSVNQLRFKPKGSGDDGDWGDGSYETYEAGKQINTFESKKETKAFERDLDLIEDTIQGMEEILQLCFGDHVQITVTKDNIEVDEYSHD